MFLIEVGFDPTGIIAALDLSSVAEVRHPAGVPYEDKVWTVACRDRQTKKRIEEEVNRKPPPRVGGGWGRY